METLGLSHQLLFRRDRANAARRPLYPIPQLANINLQFRDRAAEGVTVHAQFSGRPALVAFVLLENGEDKSFFKFAHSFGVKNIASVHLQDQRFQLIFHDASLSF